MSLEERVIQLEKQVLRLRKMLGVDPIPKGVDPADWVAPEKSFARLLQQMQAEMDDLASRVSEIEEKKR